jgi:hypothetical protein
VEKEKSAGQAIQEAGTGAAMSFWRWLTTSRYTRRLEEENAELKARTAIYEKALFPRLFPNVPRGTPEPVAGPEQKNEMVTKAPPSLGPIRRRSWQEARAKLETLTNTELTQEQRLQRVMDAAGKIR